MGRRLWVVVPGGSLAGMNTTYSYDCRVLSFKQFLPATGNRKKHLVQIYTDPGGLRTLSVGSLRLKDPKRTGEISKSERKTSDDADLIAVGADDED